MLLLFTFTFLAGSWSCPALRPFKFGPIRSIFPGAALASSFILSNYVLIYLSMFVCAQNLLVRLSCRSQQTKDSVYTIACRSHRAASTRTAWHQSIVWVSLSVSPTLLWSCHAIYFCVIISPPFWRYESAAPDKIPQTYVVVSQRFCTRQYSETWRPSVSRCTARPVATARYWTAYKTSSNCTSFLCHSANESSTS